MELVSVVIPCFNSGRTLKRAINSVKNQTWKNIEIIIINDGSDDLFTLKEINRFKDIILFNQINRGLPAARNKGFELASGKFILPLDADDWLEANAVEIMIDKLKANKSLSFVYTDLKLEGKSQKILSKEFNYFEQLFLNHIPYCLMIYKKVWQELGGYDETFIKGYEDWEFNLRLLKNNFIGERIKLPLFHYFISDQGMLLSKSSKLHSEVWKSIRDKNEDTYRPKNILKSYFKNRTRISNYPLFIYLFWYIIVNNLPNNFSSYLFRSLRNIMWIFKR